MGSKSDVAELLSSCRWSDEGSYLGEIVKSAKISTDSPFCCVVKVVRGQYQNIGQPSFSNPSLVSHLLLLSAGRQSSIAAQCVKFKNQAQRVAVPFGPTLAIPAGFEGHFEILSEDGKSVPVIPSVEGLARKFPDSCLVRESIKGYKADTPSVPNHNHRNLLAHTNSNNNSNSNTKSSNSSDRDHSVPSAVVSPEITPYYRISDKNRTVQSGEVLTLVGEVSVPSPSGKKVTRYLRCFDSKGQSVYLNTAQKGKFSPLARQDSISGVHTTKNLLNKRMPMMVRLVDGKPPSPGSVSKSHSSFKKFVPELRLFSTIQEELIFGMPLSQNSKDVGSSILPLPLSAPLKFQVCCNFAQVEQMKEFCRLYEKTRTLMDVAKNLIQIYDINLKRELRFDGRQWKAYSPPIFFASSTPTTATPTAHTQAAITSGDNALTGVGGGTDVISTSPNPYNSHNYDVPDVQDYEDIDQIYDYVRGVKPIPKSSHVQHYHPKIQHPTTQVVIAPGNSGGRPKVSRAAAVVEKKITRHYLEERKSSNVEVVRQRRSSGSGSTPSPTKQQPNQPMKPPRKLSAGLGMRRACSEDRILDVGTAKAILDEKPEPPPIETIPTHKNKLTNGSASEIKSQAHAQRSSAVKSANHRGGVFNEDDDGFNANYGDGDGDGDELDEDVYSSCGDEDEFDGLKVTTRHANCYQHEVTCHKKLLARNPLNFNHRARKSVEDVDADDHYQEIGSSTPTADDEERRKLIQKAKNTTKVLISCESSPNGTTDTNTNTTSSSGVSSGEVGAIISITANDSHVSLNNCANNDHALPFDPQHIDIDGGAKVKVKKHHYIKRNSQNFTKHDTPNVINVCSRACTSPSPTPNPASTTATVTPSGIISGSPSNRIIFRRSPIFDCRYKSMNDLNRGSLESNSGSSSSGGGGGLGAKLSRYFQFGPQNSQHGQHGHNHNHNHNHSYYHPLYERQGSSSNSKSSNSKQFGSSSSGFLSRGSPHYHSNSNINVNLLNLNIKASSRHKALFRPKSLTNLVDITPASVRGLGGLGFGKLGGSGAGKSSCRKKLLDNMVMPSHNHGQGHAAIHSSVPSFDVFHKMNSLTPSSGTSSKRNSYCSSGGGGSRKNSHLPSLYL